MGLKAGGSIDQRAERLFATKDKLGLYEMDPSLLAGAGGGGTKAKTANFEQIKENKKALL